MSAIVKSKPFAFGKIERLPLGKIKSVLRPHEVRISSRRDFTRVKRGFLPSARTNLVKKILFCLPKEDFFWWTNRDSLRRKCCGYTPTGSATVHRKVAVFQTKPPFSSPLPYKVTTSGKAGGLSKP